MYYAGSHKSPVYIIEQCQLIVITAAGSNKSPVYINSDDSILIK